MGREKKKYVHINTYTYRATRPGGREREGMDGWEEKWVMKYKKLLVHGCACVPHITKISLYVSYSDAVTHDGMNEWGISFQNNHLSKCYEDPRPHHGRRTEFFPFPPFLPDIHSRRPPSRFFHRYIIRIRLSNFIFSPCRCRARPR